MEQYKRALHIFRRDLRLIDNTALNEALKSAENVIPCFIFDPQQIETNDYKSENCLQFMVESLQDLDQALKKQHSKLYLFYGDPTSLLKKLIPILCIDAIFINRDYTPFSIKRDLALKKLCQDLGIAFHAYADALLQEPESVLKKNQQPYTVFTPFFRVAKTLAVAKPAAFKKGRFYQTALPFSNETRSEAYLTPNDDGFPILQKLAKKINNNIACHGGREEGLNSLKGINALNQYVELKDFPILSHTSKLSAHLKFGTLSIREVYARIAENFSDEHELIRALYWRDFFTHIAFHFPHVFKTAFHQQYSDIKWKNNAVLFRAWCEGNTGFPMVDAAMRELNTTGFISNRMRMVVGSFLVKDCQIDWRHGEKYFAQKLVDYDPAVNNGNWQWVASTGCDAQPFFRVFNPWLAQKKFDREGLYVKKWIPELATVPPKILHDLPHYYAQIMTNYPRPIVDHKVQRKKIKALYTK